MLCNARQEKLHEVVNRSLLFLSFVVQDDKIRNARQANGVRKRAQLLRRQRETVRFVQYINALVVYVPACG